jgi:hypothetical protein
MSPPAGTPIGQIKTFSSLADLLLSSLEALAAAGQADAACRLAGHACAILRKDNPTGWRKFNAQLHRLSRLTTNPAMVKSEPVSKAED